MIRGVARYRSAGQRLCDNLRQEGESFPPTSALLIWDEETEPPAWVGPMVLWCLPCGDRKADVFSLPEIVDQQAAELRSRYLAFLHEVGQAVLGGKSIIDHLEIRPGLSYWWMTHVAQKDVYGNSPHIYDAIKLLALEYVVGRYRLGSVLLRSSKKALAGVLRSWCMDAGIRFEWLASDGRNSRRRLPGALYKRLPALLRALVTFLTFTSSRITSAGQPRAATQCACGGVAIFDILTHLGPESLSRGVFDSGYWTNLVDLLAESKRPVDWVHLFYRHPAVPDMRTALTLVRRFNRKCTYQAHRVVDSRMSLKIATRVLGDFCRLLRVGLSMKRVEHAFRLSQSRLNLWPLFKTDWTESLRGSKAMVSLFHLNLLEEEIGAAPRHDLGIYIQENQPWELALVYLWKRRGHGTLVGVAHSTVPFWDLRYFFDPRTFRLARNRVPLPDFVALNGPDSVAKFAQASYPAGRVCEVEALRYLHLEKLCREDLGYEGSAAASPDRRPLRLLVLGDLLPAYTATQLSFLACCSGLLSESYDVVFKPHPASAQRDVEIGLACARISSRHIREELADCDVVLVGSATSSAADAYQIGLPVISINDGDRINFSPVLGSPDVRFVRSPEELASALSAIRSDRNASRRKRQAHEFFTLDATLPRWRRLLSLA